MHCIHFEMKSKMSLSWSLVKDVYINLIFFFYKSRKHVFQVTYLPYSSENVLETFRFFVCLDLSSHSRLFHSYGDVTITGEGLPILTFARHSWPLSSVGSLAWQPYCDPRKYFVLNQYCNQNHKWEKLIGFKGQTYLHLHMINCKISFINVLLPEKGFCKWKKWPRIVNSICYSLISLFL
mgnify:CR=1 FL=1